MLRVSNSLIHQRVLAGLIRGNVLRTNLFTKENNKPQFERIILLNNNFDAEDIYYVMSTSSIGWYEKYWYNMKKWCLWVDVGTVDTFDKTVVVNCRRIDKLTKQNLIDRYTENKLDFLDVLPKKIMEEIDKIIEKSKLITNDIKKLVL